MKPSKYIIAETRKYNMVRETGLSHNEVRLLTHFAEITWNSGDGNDAQVPGEIRLCVGGKTFIYKVEE